MLTVRILFSISILVCFAIAYVLGLFWFSDKRNRKLRSFFYLGIFVFMWTFLNAVVMVSSPAQFPFIYTIRMTLIAIVPFSVVWFILEFIQSRLIRMKLVRYLLIAIPIIDIFLLLTNPLHHMYFTDMSPPLPSRGLFFWGHLGIDFLFIIVTFVLLIIHIIKSYKNNPLLILTGVGLILPYVINIMYSMQIIQLHDDITPLGFFVAFLMFVLVAYRNQIFHVKMGMFSSTMDSLSDLILLFNEKGILMDINTSALKLFHTYDISIGRTKKRDFFNEMRRKALTEEWDAVVNAIINDEDVQGEICVPLGEHRNYSFSYFGRMHYEGKSKIGYIFMLTDITNYRLMIDEINLQNQQLVELNKLAESASIAKTNFLSNMSHEIRTPINAIVGMTKIALETNEFEKKNYALEKINGASTHLLSVVNDILDIAKIEAKKFELVKENFSFQAVLEQVDDVISFRIKEKFQELTITSDENIPKSLLGDKQRLAQVLTNLISNANKFTPEYGKIILKAKLLEQKDTFCNIGITVSDTGIGIDQGSIAKLFDAFEQAENNTSRRFGGSGLGLSITKSFVELMGGTVSVESEIGVGSTFTINIWLEEVKGQNDIESNMECIDLSQVNFSGKCILLAEDVEINQEIVLTILEPYQLEIVCCANGREAVDTFVRNPEKYHLILMDIQMPEVNGVEATQEIRSLPYDYAKTVPIIAMTANVFREEVDSYIAAGMNKHIGKPIDFNELIRTLHSYL